MSLQWTAVAAFLYVEIGLTLLLILPLLKPSIWKWIFSRSVFSAIQPVWTTVYYAILLVLVVLFIDSIRIMRKYGNELPEHPGALTLDAKLDRRLNECRGQRNFYITGFALFLILVIRRLITMLGNVATLEASHTATLRQAQAANAELARRIDKESSEAGDKQKEGKPSGEEVKNKEDYKKMEDDLKKTKADLEAMKKQAESTSAEYNRLAEEHQKLLNDVENKDENKKDQ
ncbi:B-cell receptor-associated protein 29-like isoform X2 [Halichondria panicea]|uniref:B-cell receptor-associated protein 29-like isoform X1 n=1 Tax=Halichondria panicea TaxID=6063 RepID=UPI00312B8B3A